MPDNAAMLTPDGPPLLRTQDLTRRVGPKILVEGISVEVRTAEVLAVVGPSGSGKSFFLRLLNRLDEPTSGSMYLAGTDYRQIAPRELRRQMGMVTQRAFLFPGTVASNLAFGPRQRGEALTSKKIQELVSMRWSEPRNGAARFCAPGSCPMPADGSLSSASVPRERANGQ